MRIIYSSFVWGRLKTSPRESVMVIKLKMKINFMTSFIA